MRRFYATPVVSLFQTVSVFAVQAELYAALVSCCLVWTPQHWTVKFLSSSHLLFELPIHHQAKSNMVKLVHFNQ